MAKRVLTPLESTLQTNVKRLIEKHYDGKPGRLKKQNPLVRLATIQDVVKGGGCSIASLGPIAKALKVDPYQLLIRNLDVEAPQEAITAAQMRAIRQLREEA